MRHTLLQSLQRLHYPTRFSELSRLLHNLQSTPEALHQQQQQALTALIDHAAHQVPYYRELQWEGSLQSLPILEKEAVIHHLQEMIDISADHKHIHLGYTGGSTGTPLAYYYDQQKLELMRAGQYRSFMQCGWRPGERALQLWGAAQDLPSTPSLKQHWHRWISAEQTIGAFELDESQLHHWCRQIIRFQPVVVRGYPSILAELAHYILDQQITLPHTIKGCYSTAEVLYPHQRKQIEQALGCKVYNQYGSREIPNISCECSHGQQHVFTDLVALESMEREGEPQLLVTSLTNRLMPFIRYAIGDSGRLLEERCDCGSPFPLMEMRVCRSNDLIQAPNGKQIYPSALIHLLDGIDGIHQYQFVQRAIDQLTLRVALHQPLEQGLEQRLQQQIRQQMGEKMQLQIETVDEIPRNHSGKHRFVCCEL